MQVLTFSLCSLCSPVSIATAATKVIRKKHHVYKDAHYLKIGSLVFAINLVYNLVYQYTH